LCSQLPQQLNDQVQNATPGSAGQTSESAVPGCTEVSNATCAGEVQESTGNSPPSLSELATRQAQAEVLELKTNERRAWAECPQEPSTPTNFCDDPTPLEASLVATSGTGQKHQSSSDSGGEDSAKENKECISSGGEKAKNPKKKGK
jgi:hypothetical protein